MSGSRNCRPLIHIFGRIHLTLHDADDATKVALIDSETSNFLIVPRLSNEIQQIEERGFGPSSLTEIFKFDEMICHLERKCPHQKLVMCAGRTYNLQARTAFLVGCHLIISQGIELEESYTALERLHGVFDHVSLSNGGGLSVRSCLSAIHAAKKRDWIDFQERFDTLPNTTQSIQIDEYMHYARW
jgi:hypothetical protein